MKYRYKVFFFYSTHYDIVLEWKTTYWFTFEISYFRCLRKLIKVCSLSFAGRKKKVFFFYIEDMLINGIKWINLGCNRNARQVNHWYSLESCISYTTSQSNDILLLLLLFFLFHHHLLAYTGVRVCVQLTLLIYTFN